jgi:hypothetical protein
MLAPGEFLTSAVPNEPTRDSIPLRVDAIRLPEPRPTAPTAVPEEAEPRSFLRTLLNALGAVHT